MGACTSSIRRRQRQHRQSYKRTAPKDSIILDNKQLSPLPLTEVSDQQTQYPQSFLSHIDTQYPSSTGPVYYKTDTNSLIQFHSSNTNNNNNNHHHHRNIINSMSSSTSSQSNSPPRIPVPQTRLPVHQPQSSSTSVPRSKTPTVTVQRTNPTGSIRPPMSTTNRPSLPLSSQHPPQPRLGFIPRLASPVIQQAQASSLSARSRSISPSSTISTTSSTSNTSQRLAKTQSIPKPSSNRVVASSLNATSTTKSKLPPTSKSTITNRTPLRATPGSTSIVPSAKTDVNAIRDRYKTPNRINFFTRRTPLANSLKSSSIESSTIKEEKIEQSPLDEQTSTVSSNDQNNKLKIESSEKIDSTPPSAQGSQSNRYRQRATSTLSSSSRLSDALNQDLLLDDDNCSLKSDDLICGFDDTLTLDSASKNGQTDSCSSTSLASETNKKPTMITPVLTSKPNIPPFQSVFKEHRSATIAKCSTNGNLRESLDELTELSNRMDNFTDNEHYRRLLTRSVSLKPPATSLPPREDGEQITMDIESYRQVMKDVMVVKTILHQLDRLLKHSDGANMTDSMIGSFHESMINSRRYSSSGSGDNNPRNSIDENSSYDDLVKELVILRKEREQDKQTIKLLQEQMYKYSSQTNG